VDDFPNQFSNRESLDLIITEYGIASMAGRTIRERALAIIDIAHPDDRVELVRKAKEENILYPDQIYLEESGHLYPDRIACTRTFKDGLTVHFRAIKPSDEGEMRRLFYRFSDKAVFYRYFTPIKVMSHTKMQEYVNVDYRRCMSVVGIIEDGGIERLIAEGRYVLNQDLQYADTAFFVDEKYHGRGIASFLLNMLMKSALEQGIKGFTADILADNKAMIKVFEKSCYPIKALVEHGVYHFTINFSDCRDASADMNVQK
jgi:RimJ/RimL family protein N-acetyltransferase